MRGLISGVWHRQIELPSSSLRHKNAIAIEFHQSGYQGWIESDAFIQNPERFHLYVSYACPFAHRVILARTLLGLEDRLSMSVLDPYLGGDSGWSFAIANQPSAYEGVTSDHLYGSEFLYEIYLRSNPNYTGRVTVPVLWDKDAEKIVSTNSLDIMRMMNLAFGNLPSHLNLYPQDLRASIDQINDQIAQTINLGVYRVGAAMSQTAYETVLKQLFDALVMMDTHLENRSFVVGNQMTESDCLLFATAIRFDIAYYPVMYTSLQHWADFPNLAKHLERLMAVEAIAKTVKFDQYVRHYFDDDSFINRRRFDNGHFAIPIFQYWK
jgi:glutathionyl-hydroquinone reductase